MTPKEKAQHLIDYYRNNVYKKAFSDSDEYKDRWYFMDSDSSKQAALIAVDEIIKVGTFHRLTSENQYWVEVKQEIEAL